MKIKIEIKTKKHTYEREYKLTEEEINNKDWNEEMEDFKKLVEEVENEKIEF